MCMNAGCKFSHHFPSLMAQLAQGTPGHCPKPSELPSLSRLPVSSQLEVANVVKRP